MPQKDTDSAAESREWGFPDPYVASYMGEKSQTGKSPVKFCGTMLVMAHLEEQVDPFVIKQVQALERANGYNIDWIEVNAQIISEKKLAEAGYTRRPRSGREKTLN